MPDGGTQRSGTVRGRQRHVRAPAPQAPRPLSATDSAVASQWAARPAQVVASRSCRGCADGGVGPDGQLGEAPGVAGPRRAAGGRAARPQRGARINAGDVRQRARADQWRQVATTAFRRYRDGGPGSCLPKVSTQTVIAGAQPAGSGEGRCPSWLRMVMLSQVTHNSAIRPSRIWATPEKVNLVVLPLAGNGPRSPSWVPS